MKMGVRVAAGLLGFIVSYGMAAHAPAGAPAGSNGTCKDGSYSTAATKDGACRGHKGVQAWYGASATKAAKPSTAAAAPKSAAPAPAPAATPMASKPASAPMAVKPAAQATAPMPAPAPAQNSSTMVKPSAAKGSVPKGELAEKTAAPGGGNGLVWVNTASNVYHCQGTAYYGKTKAGAYMSEADAKGKGARADAGKPCMK